MLSETASLKTKTGVLRFLCQAIEAFSFYFRTRSLSFLSFLIDTMNLYMEILGRFMMLIHFCPLPFLMSYMLLYAYSDRKLLVVTPYSCSHFDTSVSIMPARPAIAKVKSATAPLAGSPPGIKSKSRHTTRLCTNSSSAIHQ